MTNEEAIRYLIVPIATSTKPSAEYLKQKEAYELAIKALEERKQGEWTDLSTDGRHIGWIACSVCGQEPPSESNLDTDFCPSCGADMTQDVRE